MYDDIERVRNHQAVTCIGYHETNRQQAVKCHPYKSA